MMSSRINRMQKLVELSDIELDKAAQTLAALQAQYDQELTQLETLTTYIKEYSGQSANPFLLVTPIQLQTTQCFGDKLRQAVESQSVKVERLDAVVEKGREEWLEKKVRKESLLALLNKLKQAHLAKLDKQEQRALDELAAQKVVLNKKKR